MATRTVRLDEESERALEEVRRLTGLSVSGALKRGLLAARQAVLDEGRAAPYEVYRTIDLGRGGHARVPARRAKRGLRALLRSKHRR
jgi:hypothetical protein